MKIIMQLGIIFMLSVMGELLSSLISIPIPSSIMALVLMLILLFSRVLREENIKESSDFLRSNMAFFFIPACVGLIDHLDTLKSAWLELIVISAISFFITFAVSGLVAELTIRAIDKRNNREAVK